MVFTRTEKSCIRLSWFLLIITFLFSACNKSNDGESGYTEMELKILQLINQYRISNELDILEMNMTVYSEAISHTNYMIKEGSISHDNSSERFSRIANELGSTSFAENVAQGQKTAAQVVNAWLNSEGHRRNIVGNYSITGISAVRNEQGMYFYTQIFAR